MTKISDIKSGAVFAIPLDKGYGYAYAKIIFSADISPDIFDTPIIKIYDLYSTVNICPFDKSFFETDNLLFFPWLMWGLPPLRGQKKWLLLGHADLTAEDKIFPDYLGVSTLSLETAAKGEYGISYRRNFENKRIYSKDISHVQHLGQDKHRSTGAVVQLLTMNYARNIGKELKDIYSTEELKANFWIEHNWEDLLRQPDIKANPKIIRLRAINNSNN